MSEYDKVLKALKKNSIKTAENSFSSDRTRKALLSGDSAYQVQMITTSVINNSSSSIVLLYQDRFPLFLQALGNNPRCVFIGEDMDTIYRPFAGHRAKAIKNMLISIANNPSANFKLLLGIIAELLEKDPFITERFSDDFVSLDFFCSILDRFVQTRKISEEEKNRYYNKLRSCSASFSDFDALIAELPACVTKSENARFRRIQSLQTFISERRIIVFIFQGDFNHSSDKTLLQLLSLDLHELIYNTNESIRFIVDDFTYEYLRPFERFFEHPNLSAVINLCSSADYTHNKMYEQFVKSKFDAYGIFRHHNNASCEFWSNAIGMAEFSDRTYGNSTTKGTNIPYGLFNGSIFNRQTSETVNVHYIDKNIIKPYIIKELNPSEFLYFEKGNGILRRLHM